MSAVTKCCGDRGQPSETRLLSSHWWASLNTGLWLSVSEARSCPPDVSGSQLRLQTEAGEAAVPCHHAMEVVFSSTALQEPQLATFHRIFIGWFVPHYLIASKYCTVLYSNVVYRYRCTVLYCTGIFVGLFLITSPLCITAGGWALT